MDIQGYRDEILLNVTGGVLETELTTETMDAIIASSLREIQRYINTTKIVSVPYKGCIDMSQYNTDTVVGVYRESTVSGLVSSPGRGGGIVDPSYAAQWQLMHGYGNLANVQNFTYDYAAYNAMLQIRNTLSTDLSFRYDMSTRKLYINVSATVPQNITIEYIPKYSSVEEITDSFWTDQLLKMVLAKAKIVVGRIRTRYKETGAQWTDDGDKILEEGTKELENLQTYLRANTDFGYPVD